MYDYESKEEVPSSPPTAVRKSIATTIDFVYSSAPHLSEIDVIKLNNASRVTATTSTVSEDMKSNDVNYHKCESPAVVPSSTSSSLLLCSQAEESIDTPIISNRPIKLETPPLLCLPPTLSSQNHLNYKNSTSKTKANHQLLPATVTRVQITSSTKKSPRFSSTNDAPIIMSGTVLNSWTGKQNKNTTDKEHDTILSERLPAFVELVTFQITIVMALLLQHLQLILSDIA